MSITDIGNLFTFCGGLGMFLYGMRRMSEGIQKSAGSKMRQLMGILTNNRLVAVLVGAVITAILQSSGATTVMVVGFVNAGIMTLTQAVGIIMGANIGICITAWIVSLGQLGDSFKAMSPDLYAPLLIGIGSFLLMYSKKQIKQMSGEIIVGLGLLFLGLSFMKNSARPYIDLPIFIKAFEAFGSLPILGILAGAIATAIMQSSSAFIGILQTIAVAGGAVTSSSAIFISMGSNIGSCFTTIISSIGASKNAKRVAAMHLIFNMVSAVIFGAVFFIYFQFNQKMAVSTIDSVGISLFYTMFNITCTVLLFPFANFFVKLSAALLPDEQQKRAQLDVETEAYRHLDKRMLETPTFAVESALKEVVHMGQVTLENTKLAIEALKDKNEEKILEVYKNEKTINNLENILTEYLGKINNLSLTEQQHLIINNLFYTISDIERIGDHTENIAEQAEYMIKNNISFSSTGKEDILVIAQKAIYAFSNSIECRNTNSKEALRKVIHLEDEVDMLEEELRDKHIARLSNCQCNSSSGVVFLDILSNLERIADHAYNIAGYVKDEM